LAEVVALDVEEGEDIGVQLIVGLTFPVSSWPEELQ